jgi:hypothetical protein
MKKHMQREKHNKTTPKTHETGDQLRSEEATIETLQINTKDTVEMKLI